MHNYQIIINNINYRIAELGISLVNISDKIGVSYPTLHKFLSGKHEAINFKFIILLLDELKLDISTKEIISSQKMIEQQAQRKAKQLAKYTAATNAIECQYTSNKTMKTIEQNLTKQLETGSRRALWS